MEDTEEEEEVTVEDQHEEEAEKTQRDTEIINETSLLHTNDKHILHSALKIYILRNLQDGKMLASILYYSFFYMKLVLCYTINDIEMYLFLLRLTELMNSLLQGFPPPRKKKKQEKY